MIVKIHRTPNGRMLAICDSDILGRVFEEGKKQLDLSSQFYQGEDKSEGELKELLKTGYIINAVGEDSVRFLLKNRMIFEKNIKKISGIPYAQCVVDR